MSRFNPPKKRFDEAIKTEFSAAKCRNKVVNLILMSDYWEAVSVIMS